MATTTMGGRGSGFRITVTGFDTVLKNLKLTAKQRPRIQKFLEQEAAKVMRIAKATVPVDTARLQESHRILTYGSEGTHTVRVDVVAGGISVRGKMVSYAQAVHEGLGVHKGNPRPWLKEAVAAVSHGFDNRLKKVIKIYGTKGSI